MKQQAIGLRPQFDAKQLEYYSYARTMVEAADLSYWIGNPSVSIINGSISLKPLYLPSQHFEACQDYLQQVRLLNTKEEKELSPVRQQSAINNSPPKDTFTRSDSLRSQFLVLCGIPNSKSPVEILQNSLLGQYRGALTEVRVVKTVQLRYYALLLRFRNRKAATSFFQDLFGLQYNQIEMERIILREIDHITLAFSEIAKENSDLNLLRKLSEQTENDKLPPEAIFMTSHKRKMQEPTIDRLQCAICLEDVATQSISILCGHYFHSPCLERWQFNTCPLCRYHQQPPVISFCQECNQCEGLWVCLTCGKRLCCGNVSDILGEDSHIYQHFKDAGHSLSMGLETKYIFDARVPAFLHQMFYKQMVRRGAQPESLQQQPNKGQVKKDKLNDTISMYQGQVAQEMQRQRLFFEEAITREVRSHREQIYIKQQKIKQLQNRLKETNIQLNQISLQSDNLTQSLQQAQKQQKIISHLQKLQTEKLDQFKNRQQKFRQLQRNRLLQLQYLIQQRKQELLNYKSNLQLQQKLRGKLKGLQIQSAMFFMPEKPKRKKK